MSAYRALSNKELLIVMDMLNVAGVDAERIPVVIDEAEAEAELKGRPTLHEFLPSFASAPLEARPENVACIEHQRRKRLFLQAQ